MIASVITAGLIGMLVAQATDPSEPQPFGEAWLAQRAEQLSRAPYDAGEGGVPRALAELGYDRFRDIQFRKEASLFRGTGASFELQLFHLGFLYRQPVAVLLVENGKARRVAYSPGLFDFGPNRLPELPPTLGFAGLRILSPINDPSHMDEVIAFLGASYFRAVGRGNTYGLSARGLAIDTAEPAGEEFPWFRELYVETPAPGARRLVIHALLDSQTATGAYRFDVTPGDTTEVRVTAALYPRKEARRLGLAPLTSMFLFGEEGGNRFDDYRPEVHDSDGMLLWLANGERVWRPLRDPERLELSAFRAEGLKGFGLLQRDRDAAQYQDPETDYQRRPSGWVEPLEGFGKGTVHLVEIPTKEEVNDNVVAFFTPDERLAAGTPVRFAYRLLWGRAPEPPVQVATVEATRIGTARVPGVPDDKQPLPPIARKVVLDFRPPFLPVTAEGVEAVVDASSGVVKNVRVQVHAATQGYRAVFDFVPEPGKAAELRCFLRRGEALSETWTYRLPAPAQVNG